MMNVGCSLKEDDLEWDTSYLQLGDISVGAQLTSRSCLEVLVVFRLMPLIERIKNEERRIES